MFFLIHKPHGLSSFSTIAHLRRRLGIKKIGHTGTLDPLATGLLLVATGNSTKLIPHIDKARKSYIFTVRLDGTTDSLDLDTPVVFLDPALVEAEHDKVTRERIESLLASDFSGTIRQIPPIYSALKIAWDRAYHLARNGEAVEMKERTAEIFSARVLDVTFPEVTIEMEVSVGTYIRSIARDLARSLGLAGYVTKLHRNRIAHLSELLAVDIEAIELSDSLSYDVILPDIEVVSPDTDTIRQIQSGLKIPNTLGLIAGKQYLVKEGERYVSLIETRDGVVRVIANNIE